ncbi:uncharacterized protein LOC144168383 [Haemaphysalis longicornis]
MAGHAQVSRCSCTRGRPFYSVPRASCVKHYVGLGSRCAVDDDCQVVGGEPNAVCGTGGRCVCRPPYSSEYRLGRCVREVGYMGACSVESMCRVEHSRCSNRSCRCYRGRHFDGSRCVPDVRSEGLSMRTIVFGLVAAFCLVSVFTMVAMALIRALCQLVPLRHATHRGSSRRRRLVVGLL